MKLLKSILLLLGVAIMLTSCVKDEYYQYTAKVVFLDGSIDTIVLPHAKIPANQVGINSEGCLFTVRNQRAVACGVKYFTIIRTVKP